MTRIAVGQILQETNSINPVPTSLADFDIFGLATGDDVMGEYGDVGELAGFASLPDALGEDVEWLGLVRAVAWSGGPMRDELLSSLIEQLVGPLRQQRADGVLLSLHGAQCAQSCFDAAGKIIQQVRDAVGPDTPIVATLDLHANITRRMVRNADVLVGYQTHPHTDHVKTGQRAARALAQMMANGKRPRMSAYKIPMIANDDGRSTDRGVLAELWQELVATECWPDVLSVGLYQVQPWFDVPATGWTFYQAFFGEAPPLDGERVAQACWATRTYAERRFLEPEDVVAEAVAITGRPIAVSESHDATNSGAPGDSTLLLAELIRAEIPQGGALTFCVDPEAAAACFEAGEGAEIELTVGGKRDSRYCQPLPLTGKVQRLGTLQYTLHGHAGDNLQVSMGRAAVLQAGSATVLLTEYTGPGSSPLMYQAIGLDPRDFKIVVAKSPEGFRNDYEPFAAGILYCAAPGCSNPDLKAIGYEHVSQPLYPLDDMTEIAEAKWADRFGK